MSFVLDVSGDLATQSVGQQTGLLFAGGGGALVLATLVAETRAGASAASLCSHRQPGVTHPRLVGDGDRGRAGAPDVPVIVPFAIISLFALREFITLAPTRRATTTRCWPRSTSFLPWQYYLVWIDWYGMYTLLIPVYASVPADPVDHRR